MGFASSYLDSRAIFPEIIKEAPDRDTGIIIVVPSYDEPGIRRLLDSLADCVKPACGVEVLVIVNAPESATGLSLANNLLTIENIEAWKRENDNSFFRLYYFLAEPKPVKGWGVGLARKTGMDEAARRFNSIGKPEGVILCLDADCTVDSGYLSAIHNDFLRKKERSACSLYFEHPLSGDEFPESVYRFITLYELHLRYYYQALLFAGFPTVFHTVGSATGVKALPYVKAGGMNRKQAGEDFYFIQKLIPLGGYITLNSTTVYPSPRPSFRVPFGTGASIGSMTGSNADNLLTYDLSSFSDLKYFFSMTEILYNRRNEDFQGIYHSLPSGLKAFIDEAEMLARLSEIKENTSGYQSFCKRFFGWFNMFRIVKYLNFVHSGIYSKRSVTTCAIELLNEIGVPVTSQKPADLLMIYRSLERGT
jgi:hypothetical protein